MILYHNVHIIKYEIPTPVQTFEVLVVHIQMSGPGWINAVQILGIKCPR